MSKSESSYSRNLSTFEGTEIQSDNDYDRLKFDGICLNSSVASAASFDACVFANCNLSKVRWSQGRLVDCTLSGSFADSIDLIRTTIRDTTMRSSRIGSMQVLESDLTRLKFSGGKVDHMNFRGSRLCDVVFEDVEIDYCDFSGAILSKVTFLSSNLHSIEFNQSQLSVVDLSKSTFNITGSSGSLKGLVISERQACEIASKLARKLGISVVDCPPRRVSDEGSL